MDVSALQLIIGTPSSIAISPKDWLQVLVGLLGFIGVILTIRSSASRQREALDASARLPIDTDARRRVEDVRNSRGILYSQLSRVYRSIQGEYGYLAHSELPFIWLPFYDTLLPGTESLRRAELLSITEVMDVTAFYYSYHEQMGYIATATGGVGKTVIKFDFDLVGADFSAAHLQLKWLVDAMEIIERKSLRAMNVIRCAAEKDYGPRSDTVIRLKKEELRNSSAASNAREHLQLLRKRISDGKRASEQTLRGQER